MRIKYLASVATALAVVTAVGAPIGAVAQAVTPSYLFAVESATGTTSALPLASGANERFTLTMRNVAPVTKFADRPFRNASVLSPAALATNWDAWFAESPPNAVLAYSDGSRRAPQSIVVTLAKPRYDASSRTLRFTATRTYRTLDPGQKGTNWVRPTTPAAFIGASLFIDDAGSSATDALTAQLQQAMQPYVFAPNDASTWAAVASAMSAILTTAWQQGTLMGPSASDAYTVACQPPAQDILNGYLTCTVSMTLTGGTVFETTLTQTMATSG